MSDKIPKKEIDLSPNLQRMLTIIKEVSLKFIGQSVKCDIYIYIYILKGHCNETNNPTLVYHHLPIMPLAHNVASVV